MGPLWVNIPVILSLMRPLLTLAAQELLLVRNLRSLRRTAYQRLFAGFLGHFDFIYALPGAWLQVPFTFLGSPHFSRTIGRTR